jgi:hypothetical protein
MASRGYDAMKAKYHRIQPRVQREIYLKFQNLAEQEGLDMSKLAGKLIVQYINAKIQQKTQRSFLSITGVLCFLCKP